MAGPQDTRVALPVQRTADPVLTSSPVAADWDDYSNAGPDVFWAPQKGAAA